MKFAEITNLSLVKVAMERLTNRLDGLPALGVLYGHSGYGKTTATIAVANRTQAYYVPMRSAWSNKTLMVKICLEMGVPIAKNTAACLDAICEHLATVQRLLILDEADYLVTKAGMVELVRDIYEGSQAPILLVGEEQLQNKLKKFERFRGRVLSWIPAQPVSLADVEILASVYAPNLRIDADLLKQMVDMAHGSVRRVTVNLAQEADLHGYDEVDLNKIKTMQGFEFYKGEIPKRGLCIQLQNNKNPIA